MKPICQTLQDLMSDPGWSSEQLKQSQLAHYQACADCQAFASQAAYLDTLIAHGNGLNPDQVLVDQTLAAVLDELDPPAHSRFTRVIRSATFQGLATLAIAASILMTFVMPKFLHSPAGSWDQASPPPKAVEQTVSDGILEAEGEAELGVRENQDPSGRLEKSFAGKLDTPSEPTPDPQAGDRLDNLHVLNEDKKVQDERQRALGDDAKPNKGAFFRDEVRDGTSGSDDLGYTSSDAPYPEPASKLERTSELVSTEEDALARKPKPSDPDKQVAGIVEAVEPATVESKDADHFAAKEKRAKAFDSPPKVVRKVPAQYPQSAARANIKGQVHLQVTVGTDGSLTAIKVVQGLGDGRFGIEETAIKAVRQWQFEPALRNGVPIEADLIVPVEIGSEPTHAEPTESGEDEGPKGAFNRHLQSLETIAGLRFHASDGHWANTYLPGDPNRRALRQFWQRQVTQATAVPGLISSLGPIVQPLDAPIRQALAFSVAANKTDVEGTSRLLVQVAIKAAEFGQGRRPALHTVMLWTHPTTIEPQNRLSYSNLLDAMDAMREPEDQFSLRIVGMTDQPVIPAHQFRRGPIEVAKQQVFNGNQQSVPESMVDALIGAVQSLCVEDTSEMINRSVLLVTDGNLDSINDLERVAQYAPLNGVHVSLLSVGNATLDPQLDRIPLAGHGFRRHIQAPEQAESTIKREIEAASQIVAKALRLRLKLAPGVKLVNILDSYPLDAQQTVAVKAAEQALDQRLSRELGIPTDRERDEDGLLIVVPAFLAGDTHLVLLDVLVPGPGPVLDASLRFKDLIWTKNALARDQVSLRRLPQKTRPQQHQVVKNWIVTQTSRVLQTASEQARQGSFHAAATTLRHHELLLQDALQSKPEWSGDGDLALHLTALTELRQALQLDQPNDTIIAMAYLSQALIQPPLELSL